ncbi:hypothetical protein Tco_0369134 [Tanacetum coccineum]
MSAPKFADSHNMVAFLAKPTESDRFEQILDFLNANPIKYALTVNPTIYTSCIEQFWLLQLKVINGEVQLQALVDGKKVIITKISVRRDLQLEDAEGIECLPNADIFEQLALMGLNVFDGKEVFIAEQSEKVVEEVVNTVEVSAAATITIKEITLAQALAELRSAKPKIVDTELVKESSKKAETEMAQESSSKRAGDELEQEKEKKQKIDDDQEEAEMKKLIKIVKEGRIILFQIKRANGSSKRYSSMIQMLRDFDREDLETLWKLVKAKHGSTRPEEGYERVLWGD